jgi:hypothetical protein
MTALKRDRHGRMGQALPCRDRLPARLLHCRRRAAAGQHDQPCRTPQQPPCHTQPAIPQQLRLITPNARKSWFVLATAAHGVSGCTTPDSLPARERLHPQHPEKRGVALRKPAACDGGARGGVHLCARVVCSHAGRQAAEAVAARARGGQGGRGRCEGPHMPVSLPFGQPWGAPKAALASHAAANGGVAQRATLSSAAGARPRARRPQQELSVGPRTARRRRPQRPAPRAPRTLAPPPAGGSPRPSGCPWGRGWRGGGGADEHGWQLPVGNQARHWATHRSAAWGHASARCSPPPNPKRQALAFPPGSAPPTQPGGPRTARPAGSCPRQSKTRPAGPRAAARRAAARPARPTARRPRRRPARRAARRGRFCLRAGGEARKQATPFHIIIRCLRERPLPQPPLPSAPPRPAPPACSSAACGPSRAASGSSPAPLPPGGAASDQGSRTPMPRSMVSALNTAAVGSRT